MAIVSEASAPELAAAGEIFARREPGHRLIFRSTAQIGRAADVELHALLDAADALVLIGVFGDEAGRLLAMLPAHAPRTLVPLHADARLTPLSRIDGRPAFAAMTPGAANERLARLADAIADGQHPKQDAPPELLVAQARRYRSGRGADNLATLLAWLVRDAEARRELPPPRIGAAVRFMTGDAIHAGALPTLRGPAIAIVDYDYGDQAGDRDVHRALCAALKQRSLACVSVLCRWGEASTQALQMLARARDERRLQLSAVVMLQDFVVGGGAGTNSATSALEALDVPVLKGLRMTERSVSAWRASEDGLPDDSVHYRLAMPELQGVGQPFLVAAGGPMRVDPATGLELTPLQPVAQEVEALAARVSRWAALRRKDNRDKRVAIVYYNHPPGRHNIGADNLDVPASLLSVLRRLQAAGYDTGTLPADEKALLDLLQAGGVNLPENGPALRAMAERVASVPTDRYRAFFDALPKTTRSAMTEGPLGTLSTHVREALASGERELARKRVQRVLGDVRHLLEGAVHPLRGRALRLLDALQQQYASALASDTPDLAAVFESSRALRDTGIEGLAGWGAPPGEVMTHDGRLLVPGLIFGNVFIGPQPPRGWELDEELLHANLAFPPPHQYLAFYEHLRADFGADVVVHLGRHSTYEFLPGRRTALGADDFSRVVLGDLPSVYIYIVDGVGEGIQAKRRGQAVIVDHLTPSLSTTPLYDELLSLRQLVESYEATAGVEGHAAARALSEIRKTIARLNMKEELEASMRGELQVRGIGFDEVDGELLVHEVGHYLTELQERFMPHGLHVFARPWSEAAVSRMLTSMAGAGSEPDPAWRAALQRSPEREAQALLAALAGRFVAPGPGNDPIRTPDVLPTGRNFHALDASVLPTRLGYALGAELAARARAQSPGAAAGAEAVVLWASDTVRDEGAMVAFGMDMLGVTPKWNSRGIVRGLQRVALGGERVRRDTTFVTSGLFRDLYGNLLDWLDRAVLVALEGSSRTIAREHPALSAALEAALAPLSDSREPGDESLADNQVAAHWVEAAAALMKQGVPADAAGPEAAARVFGNAPGGYGAGMNRLVERSGAWQSRDELSRAYLRRMGHAYGAGRDGAPAHAAFERVLSRLEHSYLGRASHLYGLLDNNDGFDYLGGLGMAVERVRGTPPVARVVRHADPKNARLDALPSALMQELRGRHLNPKYLQGLMAHGYAGARTMGSEFLENLWGWQVTSPHIVQSWVWDEVKAVYFDDKHGIGLPAFLADGQNVHVKTNMQAILLVAAHKGFWDADPETLKSLSERFAEAVVEHGLPGSGHTRPDHPMMAEVVQRLDPALAQRFQAVLDATLGASAEAVASELRVEPSEPSEPRAEAAAQQSGASRLIFAGVGLGAVLIAVLGFAYERRRQPR